MIPNNDLMDLNNASRKLLTQLPGISKDLAYRIVNYRKQHGGFSEWSDVESLLELPHATMAALKKRAFLGPRLAPVARERQVLSRWRGKAEDELHEHG
jgi:hypothetical protein